MRGHAYDALVGFAGCDKTLPGIMMAMVRLNCPSVFVYGGAMLPGHWRGRDVTVLTAYEGVGSVLAGTMHEAELHELERACAPTLGSCPWPVHRQHHGDGVGGLGSSRCRDRRCCPRSILSAWRSAAAPAGG
jgi:hypothetical protein